jgi:chitin disaccharide deacetylase
MPLPSSRLIVTGDDFGATSRINQAIHRAYDCGLLQQASLMVTGPAVAEAVRIAKQCPGLTVGLHLTLCAGHALQPSRVTDANRALPASPLFAGLRYALDSRLERDLAGEIAAQFTAFRQLGLGTAYWDGHCHLHLHPKVFGHAARTAGGDFNYVRLVRSPPSGNILEQVFNRLSGHALGRIKGGPPVTCADAVYGLRYSGRMNTENFLACVRAIRPGQLVEIYYHPGAETVEPTPGVILEAIRRRGLVLCSSRTVRTPAGA